MTSGWSHTPRWHASVLSLAVFLIPAFSLALPTGYSWGAALLVLLGLLAAARRDAPALPVGAAV